MNPYKNFKGIQSRMKSIRESLSKVQDSEILQNTILYNNGLPFEHRYENKLLHR